MRVKSRSIHMNVLALHPQYHGDNTIPHSGECELVLTIDSQYAVSLSSVEQSLAPACSMPIFKYPLHELR